jgi:uncharacterized protein YijF (DUF1287 family)
MRRWFPLLALGLAAFARPAAADPPNAAPIVARARLEIERRVTYDAAWLPIAYPNGDPPPDKGVCTDVVIRSYRAVGFDFQKAIHEDVLAVPKAYATVNKPDAAIDHRRVSPMLAYLQRHGRGLTKTFEHPLEWRAGDIVVWSFKPRARATPDHVGIVSDTIGPRGLPLIVHNIGPAPSEDDRLDAWTVLGHFRLK